MPIDLGVAMVTASAAAFIRKNLIPTIALALAVLVLVSVGLDIWRPLVLSLLPAAASLAVGGAILVLLLIGPLGRHNAIGSIRACLDEYREAQQRFSPAWHRAQAGRRRGEYSIMTTLSRAWVTPAESESPAADLLAEGAEPSPHSAFSI